MRLYIGKNYREKTAKPVQSVFRLAGSDEDALTYALGFLLAHDRDFCNKLLKLMGVAPRRRRISPDYSVRLQEVTYQKYGRRDIVFEDGGMRIVLEAKIGGAEPSATQLLKYAAEKNLWHQYSTCGIVALTQVKLAATQSEHIQSRLLEMGVRFGNIQWQEVLELAINHRPFVGSYELRYLFDEFISFVRKDYGMGYYDAEILIQDVNALNAKIFKEGWMYVTAPKDKKAPLYFAPYFTRHVANSGLSKISRVLDTEIAVLAHKEPTILYAPSDEHRKRWIKGLRMLKERGKCEGFADGEARLFYLDRPITFATPPMTKKSLKIPSQIPKGFTLRFDKLLNSVFASE